MDMDSMSVALSSSGASTLFARVGRPSPLGPSINSKEFWAGFEKGWGGASSGGGCTGQYTQPVLLSKPNELVWLPDVARMNQVELL